jgi:Stage II sporulation protein E (SpoIIE)
VRTAADTHRTPWRRLELLIAGLCVLTVLAVQPISTAHAQGLLSVGISIGKTKIEASLGSEGSPVSVTATTPLPVQGQVKVGPAVETAVSSTGSSGKEAAAETHTTTTAPEKAASEVSANLPVVGKVSTGASGPSGSGSNGSSGSGGHPGSSPAADATDPATGSGTTKATTPTSTPATQRPSTSVPGTAGNAESTSVDPSKQTRRTDKRHAGAGTKATHTASRGAALPTPAVAAARKSTSAAPGGSHSTGHVPAKHHAQRQNDPLSVLGRHIPLGLPVPDWSRPIILALLILCLGLALRALVTTRRARRLEQAQTALVSDLLLMQSALVPDVPARLGGLAISAAYRPAEGPAAGGDFYDVFALADGRMAMTLGDVCGHGHQALKQAALTRYTVRAYLEAGLEPGAALALASEVMSDPDFEHYATVIAGIYDEAQGALIYASAGHPPPLTPHIPGAEALSGFASPPLGWGVRTGQRQTALELSAQSRVCFFSDGLIEARTENGLLGRDGLRETLESLGEAASAEDLLAAVRERANAVSDDMAACIIQRTAPSLLAKPGRWEELEIDHKSLANDHAAGFLAACGLPSRQREATLAQARTILASHQHARLRVKVGSVEEPTAQAVPTKPSPLDGQAPIGLSRAPVSA